MARSAGLPGRSARAGESGETREWGPNPVMMRTVLPFPGSHFPDPGCRKGLQSIIAFASFISKRLAPRDCALVAVVFLRLRQEGRFLTRHGSSRLLSNLPAMSAAAQAAQLPRRIIKVGPEARAVCRSSPCA